MENQFSIQGARLRNLRKGHGMTQKELADRIGCTEQTCRRWESGKNLPETDCLLLLSDLYGVSCDYILCRIDEKNHDLHYICENTGLSEKAVEKLHTTCFDKQSKLFVSRFIIEYGEKYHDIYSYLAGAVDSQKLISSKDVNTWKATHVKSNGFKPSSYDSVPTGGEVLSAKEARDFKLSEAARVFRSLANEFVSNPEK